MKKFIRRHSDISIEPTINIYYSKESVPVTQDRLDQFTEKYIDQHELEIIDEFILKNIVAGTLPEHHVIPMIDYYKGYSYSFAEICGNFGFGLQIEELPSCSMNRERLTLSPLGSTLMPVNS